MIRINRKTLPALCLALLCALSLDTHASVSTGELADTINIAGRQRMLSQKIAMAYFFKGEGVRIDTATQQLQASLVEFNLAHEELLRRAKDPNIRDMLTYVGFSMDEYNLLLSAPYSRKNAGRVLDLSDTLLEGAHEVTRLLEQQGSHHVAEVVNISGRQRMLSQRIAKYYIAYQAGFTDQHYVDKLNTAVREFETALQLLAAESENSETINIQLSKVEGLWKVMRRFFVDVESGGLPRIVYASTDKITNAMNQITGEYVNLAAQGVTFDTTSDTALADRK